MSSSPDAPGLLVDTDVPPPSGLARTLRRLGERPREGLYLHWNGTALALCRGARRRPLRLTVDFLDPAQRRRRREAGIAREHLARACGLTRQGPTAVLDATAGLGRDSFLLAALGARVTAIERSPVIAALLADGLRRAAEAPETAATAARITLLTGDTRSRIAGQAPDVVYLDPMYQAPGRKALAGKEMQLLQALLGPDTDAAELLDTALAAAARRVVVKRHRHAPPLAGRAPHHSLQGRSTRFDVYLPR